jgi:hypothetical protein
VTVHARSSRKIKGGVRVLDYRGTGLCPPNGGRITPVVFVQHIPVISQQTGAADLLLLGRILKEKGLAVAAGTDAEGNIALFTRVDELCYHARGSNTLSCGAEHMHYLTSEPWTERQMRAAAVLAAWASQGTSPWGTARIPLRGAKLLPGNGVTRVVRTGHASHMAQAKAAGFNDRSDPGPGFRFGHLFELAHYFLRKGHF